VKNCDSKRSDVPQPCFMAHILFFGLTFLLFFPAWLVVFKLNSGPSVYPPPKKTLLPPLYWILSSVIITAADCLTARLSCTRLGFVPHPPYFLGTSTWTGLQWHLATSTLTMVPTQRPRTANSQIAFLPVQQQQLILALSNPNIAWIQLSWNLSSASGTTFFGFYWARTVLGRRWFQ